MEANSVKINPQPLSINTIIGSTNESEITKKKIETILGALVANTGTVKSLFSSSNSLTNKLNVSCFWFLITNLAIILSISVRYTTERIFNMMFSTVRELKRITAEVAAVAKKRHNVSPNAKAHSNNAR